MNHTNDIAKVLEDAADYIDAHGWHQGGLFPDSVEVSVTDAVDYFATNTSPVCAVGGLYAVTGSGVSAHCRRVIATNALHRSLEVQGRPVPGVGQWNDAPERTKEDVTTAMRLAALEIRLGNIGEGQEEYEFEPFPESVPVTEPATPEPVPA